MNGKRSEEEARTVGGVPVFPSGARWGREVLSGILESSRGVYQSKGVFEEGRSPFECEQR